MLSAKQGHYWYHFYNIFGMLRSLTGDWHRVQEVPGSIPSQGPPPHWPSGRVLASSTGGFSEETMYFHKYTCFEYWRLLTRYAFLFWQPCCSLCRVAITGTQSVMPYTLSLYDPTLSRPCTNYNSKVIMTFMQQLYNLS